MAGSATTGDHPAAGQLHARQSDEYAERARRPRLRDLAEPEAAELLLGQQLQVTDGQHAPARLVELVDLVDLERAGSFQRVAEDLTVRDGAEDHAIALQDVVHRENARPTVGGYAIRPTDMAPSSSR